MDVVALAQLGFANAVATLGTACTPFHVRTLLRQADRIVFSFDGDAAGQRAAQRALEATLPILSDDKEIRFLFLPSEHDPDSYIRQYGSAAFDQVISQAMSLSGFFFKLASEGNDLATPEGRAKTHHVAKPWLQSMPAIALRSQLLREFANRTASSVSELEQFCALAPTTKTPPPTSQSQTKPQTIRPSVTKPIPARSARQSRSNIEPPKPTDLSEHIMRLLILFPILGKEMTSDQRQLALEVAKKRSEKAHDLMNDLIHQCDVLELGEENQNSAFAVFQDQLAVSPLANLYQILRQRILGSEIDLLGAKEDLEGVLSKLGLGNLKAEMTEITEKMTQGTANPMDLERYREISQRLSKG
jgi:DNA primase